MKKETNLIHLGRTTANTRGHADLTISLLFVSYFYTKKRKKPQTSLEEEMQRMMSVEFRGRESSRRNSPTSVEYEGSEQEDKTNHREREKPDTTRKRARTENAFYEKRLTSKSKLFKTQATSKKWHF